MKVLHTVHALATGNGPGTNPGQLSVAGEAAA